MPLLTAAQIDELRQIIQDGATALSVSTLGDEVTGEELQRLVDEGYVDPSTLDDLVLNAFTYGQLSSRLEAARQMSFPQFAAYLRQNPVALSGAEREAYQVAAQRAGTFCRGLGNRYSEELGRVVVNADSELAQTLREGIAGEVSESLVLREGRGTLVRRLRQMSGQMTRDWTRIATTESHLAHQEGIFEDAVKQHGAGELMAKVPDANACDACKEAYLGEDGKPVVHPASWWASNGSNNVGRKKAEWKPVLGAMHPWCQCQLVTIPEGFEFDDDWSLVPAAATEETEIAVGAISEETEKSLAAGTVHTWADGRKYQKQSDGSWQPVSEPQEASTRTGVIKVDPGTVRAAVDKLLGDQKWNRHGVLSADLEMREHWVEATTAKGNKIQVRVIMRQMPVNDPRGVKGAHQLMTAEDDRDYHQHLVWLDVRRGVGMAGGWDRDDLAEKLRSVLSHELTHAGDPSIVERNRAGRPTSTKQIRDTQGVAAYYNNPAEITARMHQIWREITDRRVVGAIEQIRKQAKEDGAGFEPDAYSHLHNSETWDRIKDHLTPGNKRRILRMAARAWEAIQAGQVDPTFEKARKLHGRRSFQGFEVSIENRVGSVRHWYDKETDTEGKTKMQVPYGYIRQTEGVDGDHVDVFLGPDETSQIVYVIHQMKAPTFTEFDEDKVMLGFSNALEARRAYREHYNDPRFFGGMTPLGLEEFRRKVYATADLPQMIKAEKPGQQLGLFTAHGGPFIGPRGGKWADAKHTRHWAPPEQAETERGAAALRAPVPAVATVFVNASGGAEKKRFREEAEHLARHNVGIQIVAHEIPVKRSALAVYSDAGKKGLRVMVDSGEFGRFSAGLAAIKAAEKAAAKPDDAELRAKADAAHEKASRVNAEFNFDDIFDRYERLAAVMPPGTLQVVAPDRIGDAAETRALREQYAPRVRKLQELGAEVIVPVQARDPESMAKDYIAITESFGSNVILGFPTAKAPVPMADILPFAVTLYSAGRFPKLHFLGATEPAKLAERSAQLVAAAYFAGRGIPRERILELAANPRDAARALRNVKTQDDVLTRESDFLLHGELTAWAAERVADNPELQGGPFDPESEDFDETEAWPQFMEAHPEEYDLSIRGEEDKEGMFRALAGKLSQSDSQVVGRVQRYGEQHDPLTGRQVPQGPELEAMPKVERFVPLLDRYLQAKEHVAETFTPPARSGFMALFGEYAKSLFGDPAEFWKADREFSGYAGSAGAYWPRVTGTVVGMGRHSDPARTPGENVLDTDPVTEWPPFLDRPVRKRRKLQRAAERLDIQGLKQSSGGFANPPNNEQVQAERGEVEKDIGRAAVSGHRYREELDERQRLRVIDRGGRMDGNLQAYHRGVKPREDDDE